MFCHMEKLTLLAEEQNRSKMQLELNNVAKIKKATINIDGITVIAGENNTGKSTIGKVLYSIFNSMSNMEEKIVREKRNRIENIVWLLVQNWSMEHEANKVENRRNYRIWARKLTENITEFLMPENSENLEESIRQFVKETKLWNEPVEAEEFVEECVMKLKSIINISDEKVMMEVITRWFNRVFEKQLSPLTEDSAVSKIDLILKDKLVKFRFENNTCVEWNTDVNILHEAFYIDNPFVIDYMTNGFFRAEMKSTDAHLLDYLCKEEDIFDNIFEAVLAKDKLGEIDDILSNIVGGEFVTNQDGGYCLASKKFSKPINIKNLSTGLKTFALIKRLLENGSLKEKDILILDEPEIHLHPEWQLAYAEIIVLLQKKFDLTMIITTHSPYFLDAIDVFSAKYEMSNKVNYYLAESRDEVSYLQDVTNNIDVIYKKLSDPLQKLENIRSGLV